MFLIFKFFIIPLIFIFTYYYLAKKYPILKANFIYIYIYIYLKFLWFFFNIVFLRV